MKKFKTLVLLTVLTAFLAVSMFGCYGNFTLTRSIYKWNGTLGNKYVNNTLFWLFLILPVYEVAALLDFAVLNVVQFWTDSDPVGMNEGEEIIKYAQTDDASFKITITKNNIAIDELTGKNAGQQVQLQYNENDHSWYLLNDTQNVKIATMEGNQMNLIYPSGNTLAVDLSN